MKKYIRSATKNKGMMNLDNIISWRSATKNKGMNLDNIISWNGYFYGIKRLKSGERYFKSRSVRFDDTFGGTEEVSADEYLEVARKYRDVFRDGY